MPKRLTLPEAIRNAAGPHVLLIGNVVEGLDIVGPFTTASDAVTWAETKCGRGVDWTIAPLQSQRT